MAGGGGNIMSGQKKNMTLSDILKENYESMFSAEKKVVDYVLQNPYNVVNMNISELAAASNVSNATVVRMCHHAGFSGYFQFRLMLAKDEGQQSNAQPSDGIEQIFHEYSEDILSLGKVLDGEAMKRAARMIMDSESVHIAATGNTMPLALYMGFRLSRIGIRNTAEVDSVYFLNSINLAGEKDCVLIISHSGNTKQTLQAADLAIEKRLPVVAISSDPTSVLAQKCDVLLRSGFENSEINYDGNHSLMMEMAVVESLLDLLLNFDKVVQADTDKPERMLREFRVK